VRHCLERGCEIIGHGISASQMITSKMSEAAERDYIKTAIATLTQAIGQAPVGWFGPEYGESARTPELLAQAGIRYVCDWANDEQPYRIKTTQGELFALPLMLELDDLHAMGERHVPVTRYAALLIDSFEQLYRDGRHNGRLFMLHLHPWLSGQPFRIRYLDTALGTMMRRRGVWATSGSRIIDWYRQHPAVAS
jgi:allantoinase